eukprot:s76_g43.t1
MKWSWKCLQQRADLSACLPMFALQFGDPKVQSPSDAISQMQLLQMKMNQLESLSMRVAVLRPPPGLEVSTSVIRSVDRHTLCMDSEVRSMASTSFPSTPRDELGSEEVSPLSESSDVFWL